jgi:hypothetical protein
MTEVAGLVNAKARFRDELHAFAVLATKASLTSSDAALCQELARARQSLLERAGSAAVVDAAGVVGFKNMMTRIVDASGHNCSATERFVQGLMANALSNKARTLTVVLLVAGAGWSATQFFGRAD